MSLVKKNGTLFPSLFNDFFNRDLLANNTIFDFDGDLMNFNFGGSIPSVNITENNKDYHIELAAPGLEKKDFKIEVDNNTLTISSEKKEEKKEEKENYRRKEFSYSSFSRSFQLPENCISDKIDAKYENGVLKMSLPKKEVTVTKPKKEIKVA